MIVSILFFSELKQGQTRQIKIRDGTIWEESVEVRRLWRDNRYDPNSPSKYYDIAVLELGKFSTAEYYDYFLEHM